MLFSGRVVMTLRQEKVGSGKLGLSITPGGECSTDQGLMLALGQKYPREKAGNTKQ